jgi:hypothetical protein
MFHFFPQLPPELRRAIWLECVPHRIAELDVPSTELAAMDFNASDVAPDKCCRLGQTSRLNSKPPVLTRICRESRALAFETGGFLEDSGLWAADNAVPRPWLDCSRDVVHLNWTPAYEPHYMSAGDPLGWLLSASKCVKHASLTGELLDYLSQVESHGTDPWHFLCERKSYLVCLRTVCIHIEMQAALDSGLFGRRGEEPIVIVETTDRARIAQFRELWEQHGSNLDRQAALVLEEVESLDAQGEIEDIRIKWLLHRWRNVNPQNSISENVPDHTIWAQMPTGDNDNWSTRPFLRQHWVINRDHEWAKTALFDIAELHPVIMIRLCTDKCYLGKSSAAAMRRPLGRRGRGRRGGNCN